MIIKGKLITGLGKGQYFIPKYNSEFQKYLGFLCYPGTVNIKVKEIHTFPTGKKIEIKPQQGGQVDCYLVNINKVLKGAIVIPHKTIHAKDIIEIVAPVNIREELYLNDGDEITCELV